jgi:hypothetical protein
LSGEHRATYLKLCTEVISLFFCRAIFEVQNALFVLQTVRRNGSQSAKTGQEFGAPVRSPAIGTAARESLRIPQGNSQHQGQVQLSSPKHDVESKPRMVSEDYQTCTGYAHWREYSSAG